MCAENFSVAQRVPFITVDRVVENRRSNHKNLSFEHAGFDELARSRVGRIALSLFRHPVKSREFPEKLERLVTADELLRFGV